VAALLKTRRDARFLLRSVPSDCLTKAPSAEKTSLQGLRRVVPPPPAVAMVLRGSLQDVGASMAPISGRSWGSGGVSGVE